MLLTMSHVLGRGLSARVAETKSGRGRDATRLDPREATLANVTECFTPFDGDASATVGMVFERHVNIVMRTLYGRLVVRAETMVLPGEVHAVCKNVDLGLHYVLVAMPGITNENH